MSSGARSAWLLLGSGVVLLSVVSWINRPAEWRPVRLADAAKSAAIPMQLEAGSSYEVSLEMSDAMPRDMVRQLAGRRPQSLVDGRWRVSCEGINVAEGESRDYLRTLSKRSTLGKLRRILTRNPFAQDALSYWTFGMGGDFLVVRIIGAFRVPAGNRDECEFQWSAVDVGAPARVAIRRSEESWRRHYGQYAALAVVAELLVAAGVLSLSVNAMRRRRDRAAG